MLKTQCKFLGRLFSKTDNKINTTNKKPGKKRLRLIFISNTFNQDLVSVEYLYADLMIFHHLATEHTNF